MKLRHTSCTFINFVPYLSAHVEPNNRCTFRAPSFNSPSLLLRLCCASPSAHFLKKANHRFINQMNSNQVCRKARSLLSKIKRYFRSIESIYISKLAIYLPCILSQFGILSNKLNARHGSSLRL
jgi:hypothetical protein